MLMKGKSVRRHLLVLGLRALRADKLPQRPGQVINATATANVWTKALRELERQTYVCWKGVK